MEEFYVEENNFRSIFKVLIIILFLIGVLVGGYFYIRNANILSLKKVVVELGKPLSNDLSVYIKNGIKNINDYSLDVSSVPIDSFMNTNEVGEFTYVVKYQSQKKNGKIIVKDTTAPDVELKELVVGVNEEFVLTDFLETCDDLSLPCHVRLANSSDEDKLKKAGTYNFDLIISDKYGNEVKKEGKLIVSESTSLLETKQKDYVVVNTSPSFDDYNGEITLKYDLAVSEEILDSLDEYNDYLELVSTDFSEYFSVNILEQEILTLYNKYNYIVGYAVRVKLEDGTISYIES